MQAKIDENYYCLLGELQALDFVLVELTLYLNTHPTDEQAIAQFNQTVQQRSQLAAQYEACYGPLLEFGRGAYVKCPWPWWETPWPWQV